jgi:hypothetical protein
LKEKEAIEHNFATSPWFASPTPSMIEDNQLCHRKHDIEFILAITL